MSKSRRCGVTTVLLSGFPRPMSRRRWIGFSRSRRGRRTCDPGDERQRDVRIPLPRGRRASASVAAAISRPAHTTVAAKQACVGSAGHRVQLSRFSDYPAKPSASYCATCTTWLDLVEVLREVEKRSIRVVTVNTRTPSPFASSLMFGYIGNFIYDGDAPLAERRAQALSIDQSQLRELIGETELRDLLDPDVIEVVERQFCVSDRNGRRIKTVDALHDLLSNLGDLTESEVAARSVNRKAAMVWLAQLENDRRAIQVPSPTKGVGSLPKTPRDIETASE